MEKKDLEVLADNRYFTIVQTARLVGYQARTIRHFLYTKKIKGVKHKGMWLISGREIKRFRNDYKGRKYPARTERS